MTRNIYKYTDGQGMSDDSGYSILQVQSKICKSCMYNNTHEGFTCANCGMPLYSIQRAEESPINVYNYQKIKFEHEVIDGTVYVKRKGRKVQAFYTIDEETGNAYIVKQIGGRVWMAIDEYDPKQGIEQDAIPDREVTLTPKWGVTMTLKPKEK